MSMLDSHNQAQYIASLLKFLRVSQEYLLQEAGVTKLGAGQREQSASSEVSALENLVNIKAERCETVDTTLGERIKLARDYVGLSSKQISHRMGVSLELVEQWVNGLHIPNDEVLMRLAEVLNAPITWLQQGGAANLAADSHLGVRVGGVDLKYREELYSMTLNILAKEASSEDPEQVIGILATALQTNKEMCNVARKAGGRWEVKDGQISFFSWDSRELESVKCGCLTNQIEVLVNEEPGRKPIEYGAWKILNNML